MARKQLGMIDDALLARVDIRAAELGQTRRVYVERALELVLSEKGALTRDGVETAAAISRAHARSDQVARRGAIPKAARTERGSKR